MADGRTGGDPGDRRVADTLLHPVRLRVVQALVGRRLTTQQLKDVLSDVPQASLYRHVARLVDAGILHVTDERAVRGGIERTYAVVESAVELGPGAFASATTDDHVRYFATFVGSLITGFERYLRAVGSEHGSNHTPDRVLYEQIPLWLTDDELTDGRGQMDRAPRTAPRQPTRRRATPHAALADVVPGRIRPTHGTVRTLIRAGVHRGCSPERRRSQFSGIGA